MTILVRRWGSSSNCVTRIILRSLLLWAFGSVCKAHSDSTSSFFAGREHTNNWAVLVDSSRFWFNYRHSANVLSLYESIKRLGIPDSNIILMLADQIPCDLRNPEPATIYRTEQHHENMFPEDVEVDYRGYEVTAENFVRLLTGRVHPDTPRNKRLLSDSQSNVLIYLTGHGGDGFLKFQDAEELTNVDLADAIEVMHQHGRYNELFLIADTCQSESMYQRIYSPRVLATSSSLVGQDSLSHHVDRSIGVYIIDRYAFHAKEFLDRRVKSADSDTSLAEYVQACPPAKCVSTVGLRTDLYRRDLKATPVTDFFGARRYSRALRAEELRYGKAEDWEFLERRRAERNSHSADGLWDF